MLLADLQALLARLYRLEVESDIYDFLVTDQQVLDAVIEPDQPRADEMLLIRETTSACDVSLDVSLYLDAEMLNRLSLADPAANLRTRDLNDFCTVLEGVSHFVYLVWNAVQHRSVTQLELEVQAEIDKYVSARVLLESQARPHRVQHLFADLFDSVVYRDDLPPERLKRYQEANHLAARYCYHLEQRFPADELASSMLDELRDVYRMPQPAKLSHIQTVQYT
jgi:hypothetical protein